MQLMLLPEAVGYSYSKADGCVRTYVGGNEPQPPKATAPDHICQHMCRVLNMQEESVHRQINGKIFHSRDIFNIQSNANRIGNVLLNTKQVENQRFKESDDPISCGPNLKWTEDVHIFIEVSADEVNNTEYVRLFVLSNSNCN